MRNATFVDKAFAFSMMFALLLLLACAVVSGNDEGRVATVNSDVVCGDRTILVCIPTMNRRHGESFFAQALASVRQEKADGVSIRVLVMHDPDNKPPGADFYVRIAFSRKSG